MHKSSPPDDPVLQAAVDRVRQADVAEEEAEAKAAFHLRMRARGIRDLAVLRALELVPRQTFVPHRYLDLANRDLALPIGCGQTIDEPWLIARMVEALSLSREHRVLQIGAGTGYATAILAQLSAEVIGLERFQSLALAAQARLDALAVTNAAVVWADGLALPGQGETFDRILVHGLLAAGLEPLMDRLTPGGHLVCARPAGDGQIVTRLTSSGGAIEETALCACRLLPIVPGLAATL